MFDPELQSFKHFDLRQYAASLGYAIDRRESCKSSTVMRRDGDKIIISVKPDGVFTYWSVRDDRDHGTIIDFIQWRKGLTLGALRKELRAWTGAPCPTLPVLGKTAPNRSAVQERYAAMAVAHRHRYLEERGIPAIALQHWRFEGRIKTGGRQNNAVFGHWDEKGLSGYEERNTNWKRFSAGGTKGLFLSKEMPNDRRLYICESAIDALSLFVILDDPDARFASIGGKPSPAQPALIRAAIKRTPEDSEIVAAFDADEPGRQLVQVLRREFEAANCGMTFRQMEPQGAKDWNDVLRADTTTNITRLRTTGYGHLSRVDLS